MLQGAAVRIALGMSVLVGTAAPAAVGAQPSSRADGELVLASLAGETGPNSALLDSLRQPVQLAVEEINAAGGVNDRSVRLITGDDGANADVARASLDRLVTTEGADVVIGPSTSATALAIAPRLRSEPALTCSGSATIEDLSRARSGRYFFRTAPPDRFQGRALADLILADGHERVGILARDDAYGVEFTTWLERRLAAKGAKIAGASRYDPAGAKLDRIASRLAKSNPDAVVLVDFADEAAPILQAMIAATLGPRDIPIYAVDAMQSSALAAVVDPNDAAVLEGIRGTAPATAPANVTSPFPAKLLATGTEAVFSAHYYDCTILSALAAVSAGTDDAAKLRGAFTANLEGAQDCNTFLDCKALLLQGTTIHWRGASSDFERFGRFEPDEGVYDVWAYDGGGAVVTGDATQQIRAT